MWGCSWRGNMLRKLLILVISTCFAQFAIADIATDIANGVKTSPTTQNAKDSEVTAEEAVVQLIQAGVDPVDAVVTVCNVYALIPLETDYVTTAAINMLPPDADTTPLVAFYSTDCSDKLVVWPGESQRIGDVGGDPGGSISPNMFP